MTDTTSPEEFASTVANIVSSALHAAAHDRSILVQASAAFLANDVERARALVTGVVGGGARDSIHVAVDAALPRDNGTEQSSGGSMG